MESDYIAIFAPDGEIGATLPSQADALRSSGMRACYTSGTLALFSANDVPILPLPDGGVLIGHLFTNDGSHATRTRSLPPITDHDQLRRCILQNYWGAYLIIQTDSQSPCGFLATRSPAAAGNLPCFYSVRDGSGFLTSNISLAIRCHLYRKHVDWEFITHRLRYPGIKTQRTGLADLAELLPGCSLSISRNGAVIHQEWAPWDFVSPERRHRNFRDAADEVRHAVISAVRAWNDIDRSILLELSGGLDSSIVAACLRDCDVRVVCCNLVTAVPGVDERQYARLMAEQLGVELHTEPLGLEKARFDFPPSPDSVAPALGPLQYAVDETMEAAAERHDVTAYYSGGGGDSVFCYLRTAAPGADAWKALGPGAGLTAMGDLASLHQCTLWKASRLTLAKLRRRPRSPCHEENTFLAPDSVGVAPVVHPWFAAPADALPGDRERIFDLAGNQLFQSQAARGSRRPLRFPLLSQPVMEACLRAPSWMWIAGGRNRAVARSAFSDLLPIDIVNRQSKATYMSYLGAVYERNRHQIADFLLSGRLMSQGLLDARAIEAFLAKSLPSRDQTFLRMFDLCMVENWVRHQP